MFHIKNMNRGLTVALKYQTRLAQPIKIVFDVEMITAEPIRYLETTRQYVLTKVKKAHFLVDKQIYAFQIFKNQSLQNYIIYKQEQFIFSKMFDHNIVLK